MGSVDALPWRSVARLAAVGWFVLASTSVRAQTAAPTAAPAAPPDRGRFAALWVAPLATQRFQGAGVEAGYRYHWFAGLYRLGFLQNGYAPLSEEVSPVLALQRTQRLLFEIEVGGQWRFGDQFTMGIGGGAALLGDRVDISSTTNGSTWTTVTDGRGQIRPVVSVTGAGPIFQSSVTFHVGSQPEARLSFGVCWGRHAR